MVVLDLLSQKYPRLAQYLLSNVRIDWLFHCYDQTRMERCLDIGSGLGGLVFPLAKFFKETISLELDPVKIRFQKIRASQEHAENVATIRGDMLSLPFGSKQFDLVVLSGVLEWAASQHQSDPKSAQLRVLREAERCLKPGGCLYLGSENRYGLQYWLGARDHTSLPYTGILPRRIADAIVSRLLRAHGWTKYHTYTHTYSGYQRLLREAGFRTTAFYWTYPSYSYPKFAGKLCDGSSYAFLAQYHLSNYPYMRFYKRLYSFIMTILPLAILANICLLFWPNYLVFAWKGPRSNTVEDVVARATHARSLVRMSGRDAPCSRISWVEMHGRKVKSFSKLSRCLKSNRLEQEEILQQTHSGIGCERYSSGGLTFFREDAIRGRPYNLRDMLDAHRAVGWLLRFQKATASEPLAQTVIEKEKEWIRTALHGFESTNSALKYALKSIENLGALLVSASIPKCAEHGDFAPGNILFSDGKVVVIDWELFRASGNPMFDACYFAITTAAIPRAGESFEKNLSGSGPYSALISSFARRFCHEKKLPLEAFRLGIPYALIRCISRCSIYSDEPSPQVFEYAQLLKLWNARIRHFDFSWLG